MKVTVWCREHQRPMVDEARPHVGCRTCVDDRRARNLAWFEVHRSQQLSATLRLAETHAAGPGFWLGMTDRDTYWFVDKDGPRRASGVTQALGWLDTASSG